MHLFEDELDPPGDAFQDQGRAAPASSGSEISGAGVVDLSAVAASVAAHGPAWTRRSDDLDVNLLVFGAGDGVAEHRNDEVDVLLVGIMGKGTVTIDGQSHQLEVGQVILIPKGARRGTRAVGERFSYLTCHRRRPGLQLTIGSRKQL
jgi:quercetin dioxygenase-like cupin family protein